ncbi:MAG: hypothetical protein RBR38_10490 [Desulfomicrobium apsheronum]|jgi:quinol monooxygenase YgiN|nr:hypothetical protein [Desulfomicrobium apsheronum]
MKKYRTNGRAIAIVEAERETEQCVWVDGRRQAKKSDYYNFFDTWDDAHNFLKSCAQKEVLKARRQLDYKLEGLETILALRNPDEL